MTDGANQDRWGTASISTGVIAFCVAMVSGSDLMDQIWSNRSWNFNHIFEMLLLTLVVIIIPMTWFRIRKERATLMRVIADQKDEVSREGLQEAVSKSITAISRLVFYDVMLVAIAFQGLSKH